MFGKYCRNPYFEYRCSNFSHNIRAVAHYLYQGFLDFLVVLHEFGYDSNQFIFGYRIFQDCFHLLAFQHFPHLFFSMNHLRRRPISIFLLIHISAGASLSVYSSSNSYPYCWNALSIGCCQRRL